MPSVSLALAAACFLFAFPAQPAALQMADTAGTPQLLAPPVPVKILPELRRKGMGRALMGHAEAALAEQGCLKINLQVLEDNAAVVEFYKDLGYKVEPRVSMGKVVG